MKRIVRILAYIKPYWLYATLNVVFNIMSSVFALFSFTMVIPFLTLLFNTQGSVETPVPFQLNAESIQHNVNYLLGQLVVYAGHAKALFIVSIGVVIMTLLKTGCLFLANYFMTPLRTGVVRDIRNQLYSKILDLPLSYHSESRKGDIIAKMTQDVQEIEISIMSSLEMAFRDPITILVFLISLIAISAHLTIFVLILLPLSGLIIGRIGKTLRSTSFKGQRRMGILLSIIEETLGGIRIIKAFNAEEQMTKRFRSTNNFYTLLLNKVMRRRFLASPLSEFLGTIVLVVVMWYGGSLVLDQSGTLSSETFIFYLVVFSQIINPAKAFSTAYFNIQKGMASADRIDSILKAEITIKDRVNARSINDFNNEIEFRNVSFKYDKELVLQDINLTIKKGKTIALVGQSGSGKSTLVDLIPRFIDVTEGNIYIDGVDVRDYKLYDLRGLMGIVSQQSILFNDSFFNNIAFGKTEIKEERVKAAAKVANADSFISETRMGYYSNVGDAGSKMSGGQRQRVSIARAVFKNPPILILDEATSALDTESEHLVQEAIINLMKNRTSIVIAHRLSTIKHADEICVLHEGKLVERGTHDELISLGGHYKKLYDLQMF